MCSDTEPGISFGSGLLFVSVLPIEWLLLTCRQVEPVIFIMRAPNCSSSLVLGSRLKIQIEAGPEILDLSIKKLAVGRMSFVIFNQ